jgi:hypothetical protein
VVTLAVALAATFCGAPSSRVERAITEYLASVQIEDEAELFCSSAGAAGSPDLGEDESARRESFSTWAGAEFDRYYADRDTGHVDLSSSPIVLAKAFALGKGTYYAFDRVQAVGEDAAVAEMTVRFGYGEVDVSGLTPDTTFYVNGSPPGTVHAIRIPREPSQEDKVVLETAVVRWDLVREPAADGCEEGWKINSAEVVPGSETTRRVVWIF